VSDFSGLRLALTSLEAQRRGLEVAAQNVANANTDGYSRQRIDLVSLGAPAVPALWSKFNGDGEGVKVDAVTRFRDAFMEIRAALEHGAMGNLDVGATTMNNIQQLFNEPSDSGVAQQLSDLWSSFADVANHPEDLAARTQLLERASTVATSINGVSADLKQMQINLKTEVSATIDDINSKAQQIAALNKAIKANSIAGLSVNDLEDQRDLLANQLAEASGATLQQGQYGQVNVYLAGNALVQDDTSTDLKLDTSGSPVVVRWANTNAQAVITSGKAGGQLNAINSTIPTYLGYLNNVATTLRDEVNSMHGQMSGTLAVGNQDQSVNTDMMFDISIDGSPFATADVTGADWSGAGGAAALQTAMQSALDSAVGAGNATATVTGGNGTDLHISISGAAGHSIQVRATAGNSGFLTLLGNTAVGLDGIGGRQFFTGTDAATLAVSSDVAGNPSAVAASIASKGALDSSNALNLADLGSAQSGADSTYRQLIVQLGVDTQNATSRDTIQQKSTASLDQSRLAQSGVNIDEEMTNMVEFQHAYDAAARFMTAIDSMLDTLINHTGLV
jgi:flagellar hook-associated protein 1 FlgK